MTGEDVLGIVLMGLQVGLFLMGRMLDDMSWYDVGVANQVNVFEGIGVASMVICVVLQVIRKRNEKEILKIFLFRSQLKFFIPWALVITISYLFFNIFGCTVELPHTSYFYVDYTGCCINVTQILLTNLNFSLLCNTKAHKFELAVYEIILFGEIIYNGNLLVLFIGSLEGKEKDLSILLISIIIANQILIMDLIFRAGYEDREREEEKLEKENERRREAEMKATGNKIYPESSTFIFDSQSPSKK